MRSSDPGLGVKGQSYPAIAGSPRNEPQFSPAGGSLRGRATDWAWQGSKDLGVQSNSESLGTVDGWSGGTGVSSVSNRGTTQSGVKVPKCLLSESNLVGVLRQPGGRLRSSHPLRSA